MKHGQIEKFIGKRVYVINDDTSVSFGYLYEVRGTTAKILLDNKQHICSHIKHVYPARQ